MACPNCRKISIISATVEYVTQVSAKVTQDDIEAQGSFADGVLDYNLAAGSHAVCDCGFSGPIEAFDESDLPVSIGIFERREEN